MRSGVQTFYTSAAKGTGLRGIELDRCYTGPYDEQGRRHGVGTYKFPNHMVYEGNYVHGVKQGTGKLKFPDGGWYEGEFQSDEIHGSGTRQFPNKNVYCGTFRRGEMHGTGTITYSNGDVFEGNFVNNAITGLGVKRFSNGDMYEGNFSLNKISGQGVMKYKNGDCYEGQWLDGKRDGQGKQTYGCGDVYEGEWRNDQAHGEGRLQVQQGDLLYQGQFVNGRPSQVPTKVNVLFTLVEPAGKKPPAKGAVVDEVPVLPFTIGTPLASPITVAAQHQVPLTEEEKEAAAAAAVPPAKGAPRAAPPPAARLAITEPATAGNKWETCEMESQRTVMLTLHPSPPQPLPKGRPLGLCIATVRDKDTGETRLRVLLLPAQVEPPLAMSRTEDGEPVHGFEARLTQGAVAFDSLVIGRPEGEAAPDGEALTLADGTAYLVASSWSIKPGYMKLQQADFKPRK